jgi:hypothetical protein
MVLSIYLLFKVNIENLVANKVNICKNFYIQPSELERMPYWEYEMTVKECEKIAEEEKKRQEEENKQYGGSFNPKSYQHQASRMMNNYPKMPSMPSMPKMPRI